ncbi:uncharacterized protein LOC119349440 [Triticum dicoccoides]|uniref:uncharacterized protein LOC119349440 n=1 Tax=Triticum dicoccoides TaxID=85692 RepID=UPI0018908408|nr:uncharacterized protein LOC119349440 [Triticum dicoccoides]
MGTQLLPAAAAAAAPPAKRPSIPSTTTTSITTAANGSTTTTTKTTSTSADGTTTITITTTTTATATATTTISSLREDDLREIFLRLPDLRALIRAALTCRAWLGAVRASRPFRRLFRALHPAPLLGLFIPIDGSATPSFAPLRRRSDPDVTAALRGGDFFLTSLPLEADPPKGWGLMDCRGGYLLLWNTLSLAAVNPMTWAVDIIPMPGDDVKAGSRRHFSFLGFHLLCSDEHPSSFRVVCVCSNPRRVRAAVFSSETWDWVVHPWVHVGGNRSLKFNAGTLANGSIYWPVDGEPRTIRINTATMDVSSVDLPSEVKVHGFNFSAGDTKDGQLCIVYESDFFLHVWIRGVDGDGIEIWVPHTVIDLSAEIDRVTHGFALDLHGDLKVMEVRSGYIYLSTTCLTPAGTLHCWFFSLSLETLVLELLVSGKFDGCAHLYNMAWPPSLVADDGSTGHEVEGSH